MTNAKIVSLVLVILLGLCHGQASNLEISVYSSSNAYWIAVAPLMGSMTTSTVELQQSGSSTWQMMTAVPGWGYYQLTATGSAAGFGLPLSLRLTSSTGEQVVLTNVITSINPGAVITTSSQYGSTGAGTDASHVTKAKRCNGDSESNDNSKSGGSHTAPTQQATQAPGRHTQAPTQAPSRHNTQAPTQAPSRHNTQAPTQAATSAPVRHNTQAPTSAPSTKAPTKAPTSKPSSSSSSGSSGSSTNLCGVTPTTSEPLKLLVPLYIDPPSSTWTDCINAAQMGIDVIAVINPNDGPVVPADSAYTTGISQMVAAGVTVLGYIHTLYGGRAISDVSTDISNYAKYYPGLSGIFVDECADTAAELSYYEQVYSAITSHSGYVNTIINPGVQPDQGYQNVSTTIVVFEDNGSNFKNSFSSWVTCAPNSAEKSGYKYKFAGIAIDSTQSQMTTLIPEMAAAGMGMVYATQLTVNVNTYGALPSYWSALLTEIQSVN